MWRCCIVVVFVVYWCYGTQLSVNGSATADFWGTKNAGINYGMLFTPGAWPALSARASAACCIDRYHNYQAAFYTAAVLAAVALLRVPGSPSQACMKYLAGRTASALSGQIAIGRLTLTVRDPIRQLGRPGRPIVLASPRSPH